MSDNEQVGHMQLRGRNSKQPHQNVTLNLSSVLFKPSAPDNLLSLDALENVGWTLKCGLRDSGRVAWLGCSKDTCK